MVADAVPAIGYQTCQLIQFIIKKELPEKYS
jgi:hypothetical protein